MIYRLVFVKFINWSFWSHASFLSNQLETFLPFVQISVERSVHVTHFLESWSGVFGFSMFISVWDEGNQLRQICIFWSNARVGLIQSVCVCFFVGVVKELVENKGQELFELRILFERVLIFSNLSAKVRLYVIILLLVDVMVLDQGYVLLPQVFIA